MAEQGRDGAADYTVSPSRLAEIEAILRTKDGNHLLAYGPMQPSFRAREALALVQEVQAARAAITPAAVDGDAGERATVEQRARAFLAQFRGNLITDADFERLVEWEIALTLKQQQGVRHAPDAGAGR